MAVLWWDDAAWNSPMTEERFFAAALYVYNRRQPSSGLCTPPLRLAWPEGEEAHSKGAVHFQGSVSRPYFEYLVSRRYVGWWLDQCASRYG